VSLEFFIDVILPAALWPWGTRNISRGEGEGGRPDNLTIFMCRLSWNLGASTFWNTLGLSRPVMGLLLLFRKMHLPTWPIEAETGSSTTYIYIYIYIYCLSISAVSCNYKYYYYRCTTVSGMRNTYKILIENSERDETVWDTKMPTDMRRQLGVTSDWLVHQFLYQMCPGFDAWPKSPVLSDLFLIFPILS
jgi:hypothetical protein